MLSEELQRKLETLPTQPGCYIMKDRAAAVVYVGKAVNLRQRVAQYFQERTGDSRIFIPFLEDLLGDIEVNQAPGHRASAQTWIERYFQSFSGTISAGSSEIQRNIIAEKVLGLPRG